MTVRALAVLTAAAAALVAGRGAHAAPGIEPQVSANWAGYAAVTPSGAPLTFANATGSWVVPRIRCSASRTDAVAFWVGLGGYVDGTTSLEQVGTAAECRGLGAKPAYYAWWELVPAAATRLAMRVEAGDRVTAAVAVDEQKVVFSLVDRTHGTRFSKTLTATHPLDVQSAEWIAEAPTSCVTATSCSAIPISRFGQVTFDDIAMTANTHPGTLADTTWTAAPIELAGGGNGAVPGALSADGRSFGVRWRGG